MFRGTDYADVTIIVTIILNVNIPEVYNVIFQTYTWNSVSIELQCATVLKHNFCPFFTFIGLL